MSVVTELNFGQPQGKSATEPETNGRVQELQARLVAVLEELNEIRPVQFLDYDSDYVFNFLRVVDRPEEDRIYIEISGAYDNLPSRRANPLRNGRGNPIQPLDFTEGE